MITRVIDLAAFLFRLAAPKAILATATDVALVGAGLATAGGAVVFAGLMVAEGDHRPDVPGQKYLAIFAQPSKTGKPVVESDASPELAARGDIDMAPVGSLGSSTPTNVATPTIAGGFDLVAAQPGVAWLRQGSRIVAVRRGDVAPGLGRIVEIVENDGRWFLVGESGTALLSRESSAATGTSTARAPFGRPMIFGHE